MLNWIIRGWGAYIRWCDNMGLTPENRRCCMPRLEDPPLDAKASKLSIAEAEPSSEIIPNVIKAESKTSD